jgi:fatty-acyl-CoA synthase
MSLPPRPLALEDLIAQHPDVAEVAVVGVPDPKWQERPVAIVVPVGGSQPVLESINDLLALSVEKGLINRYALLDAVHLFESLPKTSVGKIDKRKIREMLSDAEGSS